MRASMAMDIIVTESRQYIRPHESTTTLIYIDTPSHVRSVCAFEMNPITHLNILSNIDNTGTLCPI